MGVVEEALVELDRSDTEGPRAILDDQEMVLEARESIVLRCGKSSLTLRQDGRVLLRGVHVVSRASGRNKVKGGSVLIN